MDATACASGSKTGTFRSAYNELDGGPQDMARQPWAGWAVGIFEVPFEPGQSVLDGLRWIRAHRDPSLAIRFSCINANACKECMIEVDRKIKYACTSRLEERVMTLAPLSNKRLARDLVTEIAPPSERF